MKTATFASLRLDAELRQAAEESLEKGETLSSFVEQSVRDSVSRRQRQKEFLARGLASRDESSLTGVYIDSNAVLDRLESMLDKAKAGK
ncbi:prevent-host-death protein [Oxalobacteraceae bacterium OTU3CINTB1]|nr:prevent-host-death protein [Oxalobacteraceae bacterium OTU3CINTB1]